MNKPNFNVRIVQYKPINEIEGSWTLADYQKLIDEMGCSPEDVSSIDEARELCLMCLQDRPKEEAVEIVMKHRIGERLKAGQIQNAAIELADEKLWEQFSDLSLHEDLFHVGSLMFAAFPREYFEPDAVKLTIKIESHNEPAKVLLGQTLDESLLVRLLADGMGDNSILHRLFDDQLASNSFPEAASVIWIVNPPIREGNTLTVEITSSAHWLEPLKDVDAYESHAEPDPTPVND